MKLFFRWAGWALMAFFTFLLIQEYAGISTYDTCLFSPDRKFVGSILLPAVVGIVYLILLAINIFAAIRKLDYTSLKITNFVIAVPVLLVLSPNVLFYPPFGSSESFVSGIFNFLLFGYFSVIVFTLYISNTIIKLSRHYRRKESKA